MRLRKLSLTNFCQHRNSTIEFADGINLIVGPNGSGKSNLLRAIQFAFTGVLDKRTKASAITIGCEDSHASVVLDFEWQNRVFRISRNLHNLGAYISDVGHDEIVAQGVTEVNSWLRTHTGFSNETIDYFLIPQGCVDEFLSKTGNGRLELFLRYISELIVFEKIWEKLGEVIDRIEFEVIPGLPFGAKVARKRQWLLNKLERKKAYLEKIIPQLEKELQNSIEDQEYHQAQRTINNHKVKILQIDLELSQLQKELDANKIIAKQLTALCGTVVEIDQKLNSVVSQLAIVKNNLQRFISQKQQIISEFRSRKPPRKLTFKNISDLAQTIAYYRGLIQHLRECVKSYCPLCGQSLDAATRLKRMSELESAVKELELEKGAWERKVLREKIAELQKIKTDFLQIQQLEEKQKELEEARRTLQNHEKKQSDIALRISHLSREKEQLQSQIRELQHKIEGKTPITTERRRDLEKRLSNTKVSLGHKISKIIRLSAALATFSHLVKQRKEIRKGNRIKEKIKLTLSGIRAQFHRSVIPKMILTNVFQQLINDINSYLGLVGASFAVEEINEDYDFVIHQGGIQFVDKYLSGGQRIVLSLMLRVAMLIRLFRASKVLIIDEPTVYLDDTVRDGLCEVLESIRDIFYNQNLQLILVTHDYRLGKIADKVISIPGV